MMDIETLLEMLPAEYNKHDQAFVLIDALVELGFDYRHVAILLNEHAGTNPECHSWRRDETGRYSLLG